MKSTSEKRTPSIVNLTVKRRYLTEREVERLMDCAREHGRYGHRDATMILVAYRHGLRASEVCDLQWQQIELSEGRLHVHRVKNGISSVHPIRGDEMRALRKLRRDYPRDAHVFVSERGGPISSIGFHRLIQRLGEAAKMPTMATTRGPSSTTWATKTFSTPSGTPNWRPTDSKTFGGTDAPARAGTAAADTTRWDYREITRSAAMAHASSACAPSARPRCQPPSSAGSACALWALAWPPAQPRGMARWEPGARQAPPCLQ